MIPETEEPEIIKYHCLERPPLLYKYPDANPSTCLNIAQELMQNKKLFTKVCHLMNIMNLHPPFIQDLRCSPSSAEETQRDREALKGLISIYHKARTEGDAHHSENGVLTKKREIKDDRKKQEAARSAICDTDQSINADGLSIQSISQPLHLDEPTPESQQEANSEDEQILEKWENEDILTLDMYYKAINKHYKDSDSDEAATIQSETEQLPFEHVIQTTGDEIISEQTTPVQIISESSIE